MSKLTDFYKKAESDPALRADLEAAQKRYEGQNPGQAAIVAEYITIAAKHGVTLEAADFEVKKGELDEEELSVVAGGWNDPSLSCIRDKLPTLDKRDPFDFDTRDGPRIHLA
ncbi:hypothetical protein AGMMS49928_12060 [Spirochaetia bacterium]|nr:hypothetical protein AGMMS49928_12060 [Spirochaetia bacterium]